MISGYMMNSNIEELRKIYEEGTSFNEEVSFQITEGIKRDSLRNIVPESTKVDTGGQSILPKLREDSFLDLIRQGFSESSRKESIRSEKQKQRSIERGEEYAGAAVEALERLVQTPELQPTIEPIKKLAENMPGREMYLDVQRQNIANIAGLPVDLSNSLLHLLGIETSNKPFLGSEHIKEWLDWMKD